MLHAVYQAYSISGPQATSGPWYIADWPYNGLYSWLIQFRVVFSDLPFTYPLDQWYSTGGTRRRPKILFFVI
jgi:hypothetical protein